MKPLYPLLATALTLFILTVLGCEKPEISNGQECRSDDAPPFPINGFIDLDDDGTDDYIFLVTSSIWDGEEASGLARSIELAPVNDSGNATLGGVNNSAYTPQSGDVLTPMNSPDGADWNFWRRGIEFMDVFQCGGGKWPRQYSASINVNGSFFIGLQLAAEDGAPPIVGWAELDMNTDNGDVTVINKNFSSTGSIVVGQ